MKQLRIISLITCFTAYSLVSSGQIMPKNSETGKFEYVEVVENAGSQQQLYEKAKAWCSKYFKSDHFNYDQDYTVIISGHYSYTIKYLMGIDLPLTIKYDLSVSSKDAKYKLVINNFMYGAENMGVMSLEAYMESLKKKYHPDVEEPLDKEIKKVIESLKYYMEKGEMKEKGEDW